MNEFAGQVILAAVVFTITARGVYRLFSRLDKS